MGDVDKNFSMLSWTGKNHDNPKPYGLVSAGKEPLTHEELADFEQRMLKLFQEMAEKVSGEQIRTDRG